MTASIMIYFLRVFSAALIIFKSDLLSVFSGFSPINLRYPQASFLGVRLIFVDKRGRFAAGLTASRIVGRCWPFRCVVQANVVCPGGWVAWCSPFPRCGRCLSEGVAS